MSERDQTEHRNHASQSERFDREIDLGRVWIGVAGEVWARKRGPIERLVIGLTHSPGLARALVATPSLVVSWLLAAVAVFAVGALGTYQSGTPWIGLTAPALAGVGVAYAYGPGVDPAFELSQTMAVPSSLVLLARCVIVFGIDAVLGLVASLMVTEARPLTFGWLAPMTTIAALSLLVALMTRSAHHGVAVALGVWSLLVIGRGLDTGDLAAATEPGRLLPLYLLVTIVLFVVCGAVTGSARVRQRW